LTYDDYNAFCASLPATTYVVQWGGSHVWKVGGKVFAIGGWDDGQEPHFTFKVSEIAYEMLKDRPGLSDGALRDYLKESHRIVALGLSKKRQKELGLILDPPAKSQLR
jgi:predicted DNA-binding protein (MmcQ/YjbR family)